MNLRKKPPDQADQPAPKSDSGLPALLRMIGRLGPGANTREFRCLRPCALL